jgi:hypothetical protein
MFVQGRHGRLGPARTADHAVAVNQQRFGQAPVDVLALEQGEDVDAPVLLPGFRIKTDDVAVSVLVVKPVAVDRGGPAAAGHRGFPRGAAGLLPEETAVAVQGRNDRIAVAVARGENCLAGHSDRRKTVSETPRGPSQPRPVGRPSL